MLLWQCGAGLLSTKDKISRFGPNIDSHCPICGYFQESALHLSGIVLLPGPFGLVVSEELELIITT